MKENKKARTQDDEMGDINISHHLRGICFMVKTSARVHGCWHQSCSGGCNYYTI